MSEHIIEALGLSKITIKDGKVVDVTEPEVECSPLFDHHRGIKKLTKEVIAENIQFRNVHCKQAIKNERLPKLWNF